MRHRLLAVAALAASGGVHAADAPDEDVIHVDLHVNGAPYPGAGCKGGDWSLHWKGDLPSEGSSISDMLISYSAFDTTNEEDRVDPPAEISASPLVCRDSDGKITLSANYKSGPRKIRGVLLLKEDPAQYSPGFSFDVEDAGSCQVQSDSPGGNITLPIPVLGLRTSQGTVLSPAFRLTRKDLQDGFDKKTYAVSGNPLGSAGFCLATPIESGKLELWYKRKNSDPTVTLAGCAKLPVGQSTTLVATVDPQGGVLRFKAEPSSAFGLQLGARDVKVTASSPGKGHIKAEYEYDGKTATAEVEASSLKLVSINGGAPLPKLGLLGVDGKPTNKVYSFPFVVEPPDGGLDIVFKAEKESLASVVGHKNTIDIQPVKEGKTVLSAKTACGQPIGTPIDLEIVPCDDEVIKELSKQEKELKQRETTIRQRITQLTGDPEFDRAAGHIRQAVIDLAEKGGQLIINSLTLGESEAVAAGATSGFNADTLHVANNLIDTGSVIRDAYNGNINAAGFQAYVTSLQNDRASAVKSAVEAAEAAHQFGQDVGTLTGVADQLKELEPQHDAVRKQLYDVQRRQSVCKKSPPPPPPKGTQPQPPQPPSQPGPPDTQTPPTTETPPTAESPPEQKPPQQTPPEQPPPENPPPKVVGGPMCVRKDPTIDAAASNLTVLVPGLAEFQTALTASQSALSASVLDPNAMTRIASLPAEQRPAALDELNASFSAYRDNFFGLGELARKQREQFKLCTDNLPPGVNVLGQPLP
jgi:outer membrane biosynthesis protein TonB